MAYKIRIFLYSFIFLATVALIIGLVAVFVFGVGRNNTVIIEIGDDIVEFDVGRKTFATLEEYNAWCRERDERHEILGGLFFANTTNEEFLDIFDTLIEEHQGVRVPAEIQKYHLAEGGELDAISLRVRELPPTDAFTSEKLFRAFVGMEGEHLGDVAPSELLTDVQKEMLFDCVSVIDYEN